MNDRGFRVLLITASLIAVLGFVLYILAGESVRSAPQGESEESVASKKAVIVFDPFWEKKPTQRTEALERRDEITIEVYEKASGNPVPEVSVFSDDGVKITFLAKTDDLGMAKCYVSDRLQVREIILKSNQFSSRAFFFENGIESKQVFWVERGAHIIGRVYKGKKDHAGGGIEVIAWPASRPPLKYSIIQRANQHPNTLFSTTTKSDGRFELSGLDIRETYSLMAAGNGLLSNLSRKEVQASQVEVALEVYPVFGALIQFQDNETGVSLDQLPDAAIVFGESGQGEIERLGSTDPMLLLAGISAPNEYLRKSQFPLYYLRMDDSIGTFVHHLQVNIPGYKRASVGAKFAAIVEELEPQVVNLLSNDGGEGELVVQFQNVFQGHYPNREQGVLGTFSLLPSGGNSQDVYDFAIYDFSAPLRLSRLPVGTYQYAFLLKDRRGIELDEYSHFVGEVLLRPDEPLTIRMDVSSLGAVEIKLSFDSKMQWNNAAIFRVHGEGPGTKIGEYRFSRGPYVIQGLPEGKYRIVVHDPIKGSRKGFAQSELFSIRGGATASISIQL